MMQCCTTGVQIILSEILQTGLDSIELLKKISA